MQKAAASRVYLLLCEVVCGRVSDIELKSVSLRQLVHVVRSLCIELNILAKIENCTFQGVERRLLRLRRIRLFVTHISNF